MMTAEVYIHDRDGLLAAMSEADLDAEIVALRALRDRAIEQHDADTAAVAYDEIIDRHTEQLRRRLVRHLGAAG